MSNTITVTCKFYIKTITWFIRCIYNWNLQFLHNVITCITKNRFSCRWPFLISALLFQSSCSWRLLCYLAFRSFVFERTWWRLFKVVHTKFGLGLWCLMSLLTIFQLYRGWNIVESGVKQHESPPSFGCIYLKKIQLYTKGENSWDSLKKNWYNVQCHMEPKFLKFKQPVLIMFLFRSWGNAV